MVLRAGFLSNEGKPLFFERTVNLVRKEFSRDYSQQEGELMGVLETQAQSAISKAAQELKKISEIKPPDWAGVVKTSSHLERVPGTQDFWFERCASLLYQVFKHGPVGTERLRNKYGGRTQHKVRRSHHRKAGGKTIRLALQQLEKAGLVKKEKEGRVVTAKGKSLLDKSAK